MRLADPIDFYFLLVISIVRVTSWLPFRWVRHAVARILAGFSYRLSPSKQAAMTRGIVMALGNRLDEQELTRIVKGSLFNLWLEILGSIPNRIDTKATKHAQVIGWEHLQEAMAAGKGVILWESGNFGRRFWAKQALSHKGVRVHQIRGLNHLSLLATDDASATWVRRSVIRAFFDDAESRYVAELVFLPSSGDLAYGRVLLGKLQENATLCVAADGERGAKFLAVPFLGTRHHFSTGMVSLARISGASLLPIVCGATENGKACLVIEKAISLNQGDGRECQIEQAVLGYAKLLEHYILRDPASYQGWHMVVEDS